MGAVALIFFGLIVGGTGPAWQDWRRARRARRDFPRATANDVPLPCALCGRRHRLLED